MVTALHIPNNLVGSLENKNISIQDIEKPRKHISALIAEHIHADHDNIIGYWIELEHIAEILRILYEGVHYIIEINFAN